MIRDNVIQFTKDRESADADNAAQQMISMRIQELRDSGITELTKDEFDDLPLDRDRTWIFKELARRVKIGELRRMPGKAARYEIISMIGKEQG